MLMKVSQMKNERVDDSRVRLEKAFYFALGAYTEQEAKKWDQWRDQSWGQLYNHIKHELQEIKRSESHLKLIHNLCDLVGLSTILLAHIMEKTGHFVEKESVDK